MAVYTFNTLAEFYDLQDRLSEDAVANGELDSSVTPMTFTVPAQYDAEVTSVQNDINAGVPAPVVDPVALAAAIDALNTSITTGVTPNIAALQADVASILAHQQSIAHDYVEVGMAKRQWFQVSGVPAITVTAAQAGTWAFSASAHNATNGKPIGVRVMVNGVPMFEQSVDGSSKLGDSVVTGSIVADVAAGDVITVEATHDIQDTADIDGKFRAAKLF